ncbi:MAG TPA: hypothetical protein VF282_04455 [Bacillota bacterium]
MTQRALDPIELAAVVAAVAACMDRAPGDLRVTAVRPVHQPVGPTPWTLAGRLHQMDGRRLLQWRRNGR